METLKKAEEVDQPDARSTCFVRLDSGEGVTFQDRYSQIADIRLSPGVPDSVRSYFVTIQNLCVYSWFAYDFYALVVFLSFTLIEMALRIRLPISGGGKRGFRTLLEGALKRNLIREKAFSHIRRIRKEQALSLLMMRQIERIPRSSVPDSSYVEILVETLPKLRNAFAHPRRHAIHPPADGLFALRFAAEFINQLFAPVRGQGR